MRIPEHSLGVSLTSAARTGAVCARVASVEESLVALESLRCAALTELCRSCEIFVGLHRFSITNKKDLPFFFLLFYFSYLFKMIAFLIELLK